MCNAKKNVHIAQQEVLVVCCHSLCTKVRNQPPTCSTIFKTLYFTGDINKKT